MTFYSPEQLPKLEEYVLANITKKIPYGNYVTSESVHALLKEIEKRVGVISTYREEYAHEEALNLIKQIQEARK